MNRKRTTDRQQNNAGFTLVEVVIAVIILAIVSIPLIRSFASAANTTGKAAVKTRATNAAENLMEDLKGMTKDQILEKYAGGTFAPNDEGVIAGSGNVAYKFNVTSTSTAFDDDLNKIIEDSSYTVTIKLDPSTYPNINAFNFADFNTVNSETSAVFFLPESIDKKMYSEYVTLNSQLDSDFARTEEYFEENLKREIRVDMSNTGKKLTDEDGKEFDAVEVRVVVSYLIPDNDKVVPTGKEERQKISRQVFNGNISGNELQSVFIMFSPRYKAAKKDGDIIIVHNPDNIEANLYIIAQDTAAHSGEWKDYCKKSSGGLNLQIYEDEVEDKEKGGTKQPLTLYTNIHDDIDYQKKETSEVVPVQCFLNVDKSSKDPEGKKDIFDKKVYGKIVGRKGKFEDKDATKALKAKGVDGKTLDASEVQDRIYDVSVTIEKTVGTNEWPVKVELTGSILE